MSYPRDNSKLHKSQRERYKKAGLCRNCGSRPSVTAWFCEICREKMRLKSATARERIKDEVYQAYGGYKCSCCPETEKTFLTIDHINNDGAEHRKLVSKTYKRSTAMYEWLKDHGFPPIVQVLCANCQLSKTRNNGVCIHQRKDI